MQKELTEKEAEDFLEKENLKVIERTVIKEKEEVKKVKIPFPWAMKISSKKIVHKAKIGGVVLNLQNQQEAEKAFEKLKEIQGFNEAIIQPMFSGEELIIGIKRTPEFGHVIMFGRGGGKVEEEKDVAFRIIPINKKEALELMREIKFYNLLKQRRINEKIIMENLMKISSLVKKYPNIIELDINPFMINQKEARVIDARIILEE